MANGHQNNGAYPAYQQPQVPSRMPSPSSKFPDRSTKTEPGLAYFFKESPFFEIRELILGQMSLDRPLSPPSDLSPNSQDAASPTHRNNISRQLTLSEPQCARMKTDKSLRLLLFSALEQPLAPYSRLDIAFPSQIEVKINDEEVKANYKGLKNKPGSTRPADITEFVRSKVGNQRNSIHIAYALTQKASQEVLYPLYCLRRDTETNSQTQKYNLFIYLVKKYSVEELRERIKRSHVITRQSVLNESMNASPTSLAYSA
jgi:E3 SUMO-protein ligase PIAS1